MTEEGTPGDLLMPWRTAALMLGGADYLGRIDLPGGSSNQVFAREKDAVMVVWNHRPTDEVLYLGRDVRQVDLWGHEVKPRTEGHRQVIEVDAIPKFVTGLDVPVARWRMQFRFAQDRLPSIFGRPHQNRYTLENTFTRGVAGQATLCVPEDWIPQPRQVSFRLAEGEAMQQPFSITFPYNANSGRHPVRLDFDIQGKEPLRFSVYRRMDVGLGFVYIQTNTHFNKNGELEVEQRFVNDSNERVSFRCQLFIPKRRRLMTQVIGLGKGQDVQTYRLPDGKELLGETLWLRAEELQGPRVLNYRFEARR